MATPTNETGAPPDEPIEPENVPMRIFKIGDRVTRELFMDDGTWERLGDKCLPKSPLRHGVVIRPDNQHILVRWDDGAVHTYLNHGIDPEAKP